MTYSSFLYPNSGLFIQWGQQLYSTFIEQQRYLMLLDGLKNTIIITLGALLIGTVSYTHLTLPTKPLV